MHCRYAMLKFSEIVMIADVSHGEKYMTGERLGSLLSFISHGERPLQAGKEK